MKSKFSKNEKERNEMKYYNFKLVADSFLDDINNMKTKFTKENPEMVEKINKIFSETTNKKVTPEYATNFFKELYINTDTLDALKETHKLAVANSLNIEKENLTEDQLKKSNSRCIGFMLFKNNNKKYCVVSISGKHDQDDKTTNSTKDAIKQTVKILNKKSEVEYIYYDNPSNNLINLYQYMKAVKKINIKPEKSCAEVSHVKYIARAISKPSFKNLSVIDQSYYFLPKSHHIQDHFENKKVIKPEKISNCKECKDKFATYRELILIAGYIGSEINNEEFEIFTSLTKKVDEITEQAHKEASEKCSEMQKRFKMQLGNEEDMIVNNISDTPNKNKNEISPNSKQHEDFESSCKHSNNPRYKIHNPQRLFIERSKSVEIKKTDEKFYTPLKNNPKN